MTATAPPPLTSGEIEELENQVCNAIAEKIVLREALRALADAADDVGVKFFDTDTMEPEVERMQAATLAARAILSPKEPTDGE